LNKGETNIIDKVREMLPTDFEMIDEITFDTPEDVLMWLEELSRYDLIRLARAIETEEGIDNDITRLNAEVTKRLEKVIKLKRTKAEKGSLKWEDL
jgi:hypothetical protein